MANYNSIPRRFNKVTSSINHAYIDSALKEKQNTIDANFGLLQESVNTVLGQDLIHEEDRDYLKNKVSNVLNDLDNTDSISFDSKKSRFSIQNALSEAAKDPEVLKQVSNTKKIRQVLSFGQDRMKKGNLNQQNFQYALKKMGYEDYLKSGDERDKNLGNFQYLEHVDVDKKLRDVSKNLQAMKPDTEIKIPDGQGGIYTRKKSQLTQQEWIARLTSSLDANDRKQMIINGAAMYNFNDDIAIKDIENKKLKAIEPNLNHIKDLKNKLPLADEATKEKYNAQIENLNTLNKQTLAKFDQIGSDADTIGGYYMQNAMINNMAAFMTKSSEPTYDGVDNLYFKKKKLAQERRGVITDSTTNSATDLVGGPYIDYNKDLVSDIQSNPIPKEFTEDQKQINYQKVFLDDLKQTENLIEVEIQSIYNNIEDEDLKRSIDNYREERLKENGDDQQALTDAIVKYASSNSLNLSLSKKEQLLSNISKAEASYDAINKSSDKSIQVALEPNRIFTEIYENDTNIRIHGVDSDVTFKNYLENYSSKKYPNGIKNKEEFSSFIKSDESKEVKSSLLIQSSDIKARNSGSYKEGIRREFMSTVVGREERNRLNQIEKLTGEKFIFNSGGKQVTLSEVKNGQTVEIIGGGKFIQNSLIAIKEGGNVFGADRIVSEDGDLMSYLSNDKMKQYYDDAFNAQSARIPGSNAITIQGSLGAKQQSALKNELEGITNQKFGDKSNIILIKKNPNEYAIFETQLVTGKTEEDISYKTDFTNPKGTVTLNALRGSQQRLLYNAINFEEAEKSIEFALDRKWKSQPINYKKNSIETEKELLEYLGPNNALGIYASKESFLNKVKNKYKNDSATAIAKTILDNSNKFQINFESAKVGPSGGIGKLNIELNNGDILYSIPVQKTDVADYLKYSQVIPEAFLSLAAENIIENNDNEAWRKITKVLE